MASAPGFQPATGAEISVTAGQGATRDLSLALAGATDFVSVEGVARAGYRADTASLGPLGSSPILDTPYTVTVLPNELMVNGQVKNFKEASKYLPLVEFQEMQGSEILRPATRGMQGSNMQNARMDGMGIVVTGANSMESLQQIEVLNGLGAAMYGPANPSGMFNFVPKRPTEAPVRRLSASYDGSSVATGQIDFGGRAGPGRRLGYRVNAVGGDGEIFVRGSDLSRNMVSLAGDVRPFDRTVVEALYSHYNLEQRGFPGWFTYGRANRNCGVRIRARGSRSGARGIRTAGGRRRSRVTHRAGPRQARPEPRLAPERRCARSTRRARHQHAGECADRQRGQLHRVAGQRLRAAVPRIQQPVLFEWASEQRDA
jgi:iron complex outermembrane receptor protein